MKIRSYVPSDYFRLIDLYKQSSLYGGQFDENRDSEERLRKSIEDDPSSILVAERSGQIIGTVSIIEDSRIALLFRFAVNLDEEEITSQLCAQALKTLKEKGHNQVLVYAPAGNEPLTQRYSNLGFTEGNDYTCFWIDI